MAPHIVVIISIDMQNADEKQKTAMLLDSSYTFTPKAQTSISIYQLVRSSLDSHSEHFYFYFTYSSKKVGIALDQPKFKSQVLPFISSHVLGGKGFNFSKPPFSHLQNRYIS